MGPSSEATKTRFLGFQLPPNAPHHLWGIFKTCTNRRAGFNAFIFHANAQLSAWAVKWEPQLTGFKHSSHVCFSSLTLFAGEQKLLSETCLQNNRGSLAPICLYSTLIQTHWAVPCFSAHLETLSVSGRRTKLMYLLLRRPWMRHQSDARRSGHHNSNLKLCLIESV